MCGLEGALGTRNSFSNGLGSFLKKIQSLLRAKRDHRSRDFYKIEKHGSGRYLRSSGFPRRAVRCLQGQSDFRVEFSLLETIDDQTNELSGVLPREYGIVELEGRCYDFHTFTDVINLMSPIPVLLPSLALFASPSMVPLIMMKTRSAANELLYHIPFLRRRLACTGPTKKDFRTSDYDHEEQIMHEDVNRARSNPLPIDLYSSESFKLQKKASSLACIQTEEKIKDTASCTPPSLESVCPAFASHLEDSNIPYYQNESGDDKLPRITVESLIDILNGKYTGYYSDVYIVDCRFEYEYVGGHIKNSLNLSTRRDIEYEFIHNRGSKCNTRSRKPPLVIFHCEFSLYRGPILASHLRNCDRMLNYENYPLLYYPDIMILKGGFKSFCEKYPERCNGQYVSMESNKHHEMELAKFRKDSKVIITRLNSLHTLQQQDSDSGSTTDTSKLNRDDTVFGLVSSTNFDKKHHNMSLRTPGSKNDYLGESISSTSSSTTDLLTNHALMKSVHLPTDFFSSHDTTDIQCSFDFWDDSNYHTDIDFDIPVSRQLFQTISNADK